MKPQIHTFSNGLQVISIDTKIFPSLTALLLVGAGSRFENKENNGVAHFFEHMAFKGSQKYPNSFVIASTIEALGGVFNAFTGKDYTGYWIKATTEHFETVIDVISDMVLNPLLMEEEIEREKGVITEEINLYEDTPYKKVNDLFETLLYPKNPLGYDIIGSKATVKSFNKQTFINYINHLYKPKNAVLVIAGGLSKNGRKTEDYIKTIENKFKNWQDGKRDEFIKVEENQTKPEILLRSKKTEQAHFCLGFRAFSFLDKRRYALTVLCALLCGGMSSPLFIEVRERRGLCYYISTNKELYHDAGNMVTQAGVAVNLDKVKSAIEVILAEHKKIVKGKFKKSELSKAKELIKGRLFLSLEDSSNVASYFGFQKIRENKIEKIEELIDNIEKVSFKDIVSLADFIFKPERLNFAVIGPFEKKEEFEKVLYI